jgi:hypothetical protein
VAVKMLVTIIKKGYAKKLLKISSDLDVTQTVLLKGSGTVSPAYFESLTNVTYNPSRDVIISLVSIDKVSKYKEAFKEAGELLKKNTGILLEFNAFDFKRLTALGDEYRA